MSADEFSWQVRLNRSSAWPQRDRSSGCPTWLVGRDRDQWDERGLVFWSEADRRIEHVRAGEALRIFEYLRSTCDWEQAGVTVRIPQTMIRLPEQRRRRRKQAEPDTEPESEPTPKAETVYQEVRLSPGVTSELMAVLETNEDWLRDAAAEDEKDRVETLARVYDLIRRSARARRSGEVEQENRETE